MRILGQAVSICKIETFQPSRACYSDCMKQGLQIYWQQVKSRMRDPLLYSIAVVTLVIAAVNVSTKLSDAADYGRALPLSNPLTTEYSSGLALIIMLPFLFAFFSMRPVSLKNWYLQLPPYILASIIFSLIHVFLMVTTRQLAWPLLFDGPYNFFAGGISELIYEYRKDAITFLMYLLIAELQRQILLAKSAKAAAIEPVTLKSGATTILLQPAEFLFAKSAGNYAEVTSLSGTQLARTTLSDLEALLRQSGCNAVRIHRSCIVNRTAIMETSPIAGGDLNVKLRGGETLRASRRFKNGLLDVT